MSAGVTFSFAHSMASDSSSTAQAEDLLHIAPFQFGDGRALVGNLLHIPLVLQFDQRLAHQRNACAKLLRDLALDDRIRRVE